MTIPNVIEDFTDPVSCRWHYRPFLVCHLYRFRAQKGWKYHRCPKGLFWVLKYNCYEILTKILNLSNITLIRLIRFNKNDEGLDEMMKHLIKMMTNLTEKTCFNDVLKNIIQYIDFIALEQPFVK